MLIAVELLLFEWRPRSFIPVAIAAFAASCYTRRWFAPQALGVGYGSIDGMVAGSLGLGVVSALIVVKIVIWVASLSSGTSGGVLAPLLMIGAALGTIFASVVPGHETSVWAIAGMAALMGGTMRAPFRGDASCRRGASARRANGRRRAGWALLIRWRATGFKLAVVDQADRWIGPVVLEGVLVAWRRGLHEEEHRRRMRFVCH